MIHRPINCIMMNYVLYQCTCGRKFIYLFESFTFETHRYRLLLTRLYNSAINLVMLACHIADRTTTKPSQFELMLNAYKLPCWLKP